MTQTFQQHGIILRASASKESDLVLSILTEELGKIAALAKGARNSKRRFLGGLDVFESGLFTFARLPRNEHLFMLNGLSERRSFSELREDLGKFSLASLLLEVTNHFTPEEDCEGGLLFRPLLDRLQAIASATEYGTTLRQTVHYLLLCLHLTGFSSLDHDSAITLQERTELRNFLELGPEEVPTLDQAALRSALFQLLDFIEEILGRGLNTRAAVMLALAKRE